jgi:hypothetical protein
MLLTCCTAEVRFPTGVFLSVTTFTWALWPTHALIQLAPRAVSLGVQRSKPNVDQFPPFNDEALNACSIAFIKAFYFSAKETASLAVMEPGAS